MNKNTEIDQILIRVANKLSQKARDILSQYNMTSQQFNAIAILAKHGKMAMGELSRQIFLTYSTSTYVVDVLEKDGYVVRERGESDRRIINVSLTEHGLKVYNDVMSARIKYLDRVLFDVPDAYQEEMAQVLLVIVKHFVD